MTVAQQLRARRHGTTLDRHLAAGVPASRSPLHTTRAQQLTAPESRRSLADALDRLQLRAGQASELSATLRSPGPIGVEGVAQLRMLLRDGTGPVYVDGRSGDLDRALQQIKRALVVER